MFSAFSWGDFILAVVCFCALYYVGIMFRYYRKEMDDLRSGKSQKKKLRPVHPPHVEQQQADLNPADKTMFAEDLMAHIKSVVAKAADEGYSKQELTDVLRELLIPYRKYDDDVFRNMVNEFIMEQSFRNKGAALDEDDVADLWFEWEE